MSNVHERLSEIAQRLDELSEDGPSELLTLSEELGKIADEWTPPQQIRREDSMPEYLRTIMHLVEREIQGARGRHYPRNEREFQQMYDEYMYHQRRKIPMPFSVSNTSFATFSGGSGA